MRLIILIIIVIFTNSVYGQEMMGMVNSNYAGVNGIILNPASMVNSKLYLDVNLFTGDVFFENNYLYIHKEDYRFSEFLKSNPDLPGYGEDNIPFDHYWDESRKNIHLQARILGPSVMIVDQSNALALTTAVRSYLLVRELPYHVANFAYEGLEYEEQQNINYEDENARISSLVWGEIGGSFAHIVRRRLRNHWSAGITAKRLLGYAGMYTDLRQIDYTVLNDTTMDVELINVQTGFSLPLDYNDFDATYDGPFIKGRGVSFDLGVVYQKGLGFYTKERMRKLCGQHYEDYLYKIGFSIIDLGFIRFNEHTQKHSIEDRGHFWENIDEFSPSSINEAMSEISFRFYGDPNETYLDDKMTVVLPTAFSVQFDYHYDENWYFNGTIVYPLVFHYDQLQRPSVISASARYETRLFEVNLPVILYNYKYPRIGISARIWNFTIGTDKLGGFFNLSDFTGLDFYAGLKLNFVKGICFSLRKKYGCEGFAF